MVELHKDRSLPYVQLYNTVWHQVLNDNVGATIFLLLFGRYEDIKIMEHSAPFLFLLELSE